MKNIQVIDGALNCTFSIFQATEEEFALLFPEPQQDIQYAEDLSFLPRQEEVEAALGRIWERPIRKQDALGIYVRRSTALSGTRPIIARSEKTPSILLR